MIRFSSVALRRGTKLLLEKADLAINPREHVGLVGSNGSGKSSLFAVLRGELHADLGEVEVPSRWRVAWVAQETPALDRPALDYAIDGDTQLRALEADLARAEADDDGLRIGELHAALDVAGAWTVRARAARMLAGLGFSEAQLTMPVSSFSGGWRMRLNLAQALMCPSDLMLLDEPTNHLDLDAILWLEDWLRRYAGTLLVISHDRDFLDGVVGTIVHIDDRRLVRYAGDYSAFERQRAAALVLAASALAKQQRERAHLQSFIDRFRAKASKARQAQSRIKMLERLGELAPLHAAAPFSFEFREPLAAPNPLIVVDDVAAGYRADGGDVVVLPRLRFTLESGMRYGLLGINGAGKSTFIKTLVGELPPLAGEVRRNKGLVVGYFAQHQLEMLRDDQSPLWHLQQRAGSTARELELRSFLGSFNFPGEMATSPIGPLSGGEKARLALALIVWQRPNLLLLDEPTNHLDLETREALTVALAQFEGTLVLVSHDRHLLRATTEQFLLVADGALRPFDGDLDDYRDWLFRSRFGAAPAASPSGPAAPAAREPVAEPAPVRRAPSRNPGRDRERERRPLEARVRRIEEKLAVLHSRQAELAQGLEDPALYAPDARDTLQAKLADQAWVAREVAELESEWLEQQAALEALTG
jgi:ATP-binding cassette subfamily F protein 3